MRITCDVLVIGAGVTGLFVTMKLARLGFDTFLVERSSFIGSGSSARNEGWLHAGTYHATSIKDTAAALRVARRCIVGCNEIICHAPEAIESCDLPAYALVKEEERIEEAVYRWQQAGVQFNPINNGKMKAIEPVLESATFAAAFEVVDKSINTRILYRRLSEDCLRYGARISTCVDMDYQDNFSVAVATGQEGGSLRITAKMFIYATGYQTQEILGFLDSSIHLPVRFWKSHLLVAARRLANHHVFFIDPGEATMIHHGQQTIVGLNEDAVSIKAPSFDVDEARKRDVLNALKRLGVVVDEVDLTAEACTKIDIVPVLSGESKAARSLDAVYGEPLHNHIWVMPGKMTEAPFVANEITRIVFDRLGQDKKPKIASRTSS